MKRYRKTPTKLLQIRFSEREYEEVLEFIKRFGVTKREWVMTVIQELNMAHVIRGGQFWTDHKGYAYDQSHRWDRQITSESVCEICNKRFPEAQHGHGLSRHHHDGYEGENAFKVHMVCRQHHGMAERAKREGKSWNQFKKELLTSKTL